MLTLKKGVRS